MKEYAMKTEIKAEYYDRIFKIIVPIIIAASTWFIKSQAEQIGTLAAAVNESVIQQRELFVKLENFEKHIMRSDRSIQSLEDRVKTLEVSVGRIEERLK